MLAQCHVVMYQCPISLVLGCSWMFLAFIDLIGYVCGGPAPKKRTANSTSSGYGRVSTGSAGSMSAPGLRSGKLEVRKEKSEKSERTPGDRRQKFEKKQNKSNQYKSYYLLLHCTTVLQVNSFIVKKPMMIHVRTWFSKVLPRQIAWQFT